jgi:hypothetical protein
MRGCCSAGKTVTDTAPDETEIPLNNQPMTWRAIINPDYSVFSIFRKPL